MSDEKAHGPAGHAGPLHEWSDGMFARVLGRDLMMATTRAVIGLVVLAAILATIAAITG
jgi:hypothetical protein